MTKGRVLVIGLPESGKTTFLAALWEAVFHDETPGGIDLVEVPASAEYLKLIHDQWLSFEPANRTAEMGEVKDIHAIHEISLHLRMPTGEAFELTVPDVAGEAFNEVWEERVWSAELHDVVREATGAILFLHPRDAAYPMRIEAIREELRDRTSEMSQPVLDPEAVANEWQPEESPTQVKLVDLLQAIQSQRVPGSALRLSVVVSAWDIAITEQLPPTEWIRLHLPLLWQFVTSNPETFPSLILGVSAQGGDFEIEEEVARLEQAQPPTRRVIVQRGPEIGNDITVPLEWLFRAQ